MKSVLLFLFLCFSCQAQSNQLQLVWSQPIGYSSKVYTATNVNGTWTLLATGAPPVSVTATQNAAFFFVTVTPNNNLAGAGSPVMDALAGATYVNTNTCDFWVNRTGGTNGWVMLIGG